MAEASSNREVEEEEHLLRSEVEEGPPPHQAMEQAGALGQLSGEGEVQPRRQYKKLKDLHHSSQLEEVLLTEEAEEEVPKKPEAEEELQYLKNNLSHSL